MDKPRFRIYTVTLSDGRIVTHTFPSEGPKKMCLVEKYANDHSTRTHMISASDFLALIYGKR